MHFRLVSLAVFLVIYLVVAAVVGPAIVVVFHIGVADPVTAGWPFASALFVFALMTGAIFAAMFAAGLFIPCRVAHHRRKRLILAAVVSAIIALASPFLAGLVLMPMNPLIRGIYPPPWLQQTLALLYVALLGLGMGRLSNRFS